MRLVYTILALLALAVPAQAQGTNYTRWSFLDDFIGGGTLSTSASADSVWVITDTSAAGSPTYERMDLSETSGTYMNGVARLKFSNTNEAQNLCLSFGDKLALDWDKIYGVEFRLRFVGETGSAKDAATTLAFGLCSDRNDNPDSTTANAMFRLEAGTTSMALTVETDDGTTDNNDVATSITMTDSAWYRFRILMTSTTSNVKFYGVNANTTVAVSLVQLATATTFDADQYHAAVQPFIQLQKTADTNTDAVEVDLIDIWGSR